MNGCLRRRRRRRRCHRRPLPAQPAVRCIRLRNPNRIPPPDSEAGFPSGHGSGSESDSDSVCGNRFRASWNSQLNLAGKASQQISGTLLGILGFGRQFVRARAVWSQVNQPWRLEHYWYLETQHVLGKLALRRSCWCAGGWNTSNARGASRLPSRPTHAAAARRLTGP